MLKEKGLEIIKDYGPIEHEISEKSYTVYKLKEDDRFKLYLTNTLEMKNYRKQSFPE